MEGQQKPTDFTPETLSKRVAVLEAELASKDNDLLKLTAQLEAERFKYAQLQRMIYGSKRERFISSTCPEQLKLEFEPKSIEIEQAVEQERETIRVAYKRSKVKKAHPGRMALPEHLPVVETVIEPLEDTTDMVCI